MFKRGVACSAVAGLMLALGVGGLSGEAWAQPGGMPQMLGDDDPRVGEKVPNVTVYTVDGEPVKLHALDGKMRVIVFGCLT